MSILEERLGNAREFVIGGVKPDDIIAELVHEDVDMSESSVDVMRDPGFQVSDVPKIITTVVLEPELFGVRTRMSTHRLFSTNGLQKWNSEHAAVLKGRKLVLLPFETGPRIRRQYHDQPVTEKLYVASLPLRMPKKVNPSEYDLRFFYMYKGPSEILYLGTVGVGADRLWKPDTSILWGLV